MSTKAEIKAINRYNKEYTKIIPLRLNLKNDTDIANKLEQVPSKMGYIKSLIRKDMICKAWVKTNDSFGVETAYECPDCKYQIRESRRSNFCPDCGLKLKSE